MTLRVVRTFHISLDEGRGESIQGFVLTSNQSMCLYPLGRHLVLIVTPTGMIIARKATLLRVKLQAPSRYS